MKQYVGVYGTDIILETGKNISSATLVRVKYQKPDGIEGEWDALVSDNTKVVYTLEKDDIDIAGRWQFQAYIEIDGGAWHGETVEINFSSLFDENTLCGLQAVKRMIGQTPDQKDDDMLLESLIFQETDYIKSICNRNFFYDTYTEQLDGNGLPSIFLSDAPIDEILSVHDDLSRKFGSESLIDPERYYIDKTDGIIWLDMTTAMGKGNIKVVYTGGYKVIPKHLELACCQRVYADYLELKGGINVLEGDTVTYKPSNLRKQADMVIERYRKMLR